MLDYRMSYIKLLNIVEEAHYGQKYGDLPHTYHLSQVEGLSIEINEEFDEHLIGAVALAHDVCEDTNITPEDLIRRGIHTDIVKNIELLTKTGYTYSEYIKRVKSDPIALLVKRADTFSNLEHSFSENNIERVKRYSRQLNKLYKDVD